MREKKLYALALSVANTVKVRQHPPSLGGVIAHGPLLSIATLRLRYATFVCSITSMDVLSLMYTKIQKVHVYDIFPIEE